MGTNNLARFESVNPDLSNESQECFISLQKLIFKVFSDFYYLLFIRYKIAKLLFTKQNIIVEI